MTMVVDPSTSQAMTIKPASSYWRKRLAIDIAGRVAHGNMSRNRNNNQQQAGHMSYPPWIWNWNSNHHRRTRSRKMLEDSGFLSRNDSHRAALPLRGLSIWRSCRTDLHSCTVSNSGKLDCASCLPQQAYVANVRRIPQGVSTGTLVKRIKE